jgi:hypothetical protein
MPEVRKFDVHIQTPIIRCTPKGGHVHAPSGDQLRWDSNDAPFTLVMTDLDSGAAAWPFHEPQPNWPVTDTRVLTLNVPQRPAYFKYTIKAAGCADLDPIIIVDR